MNVTDALLGRLWTPSTKDLQSGLNPVRFSVQTPGTSSAAASLAENLFTCPPDRARLIVGWFFDTTAGAAQTLTTANLQVIANGTRTTSRAGETLLGLAAAQSYRKSYHALELLVLPGEVLQGTLTWSAGAAANAITTQIAWGYEFPRANIEAG